MMMTFIYSWRYKNTVHLSCGASTLMDTASGQTQANESVKSVIRSKWHKIAGSMMQMCWCMKATWVYHHIIINYNKTFENANYASAWWEVKASALWIATQTLQKLYLKLNTRISSCIYFMPLHAQDWTVTIKQVIIRAVNNFSNISDYRGVEQRWRRYPSPE